MTKIKTMVKSLGSIISLLGISLSIQAQQKPTIWIHTDLTSATSYTVTSTTSEGETDQDSDPDDHVAMAMYLMLANKFNTKGIVVGVTNRNTTLNTKTFFDNTFIKAYETDVVQLNAKIGGYPTADSLKKVTWESSLTAGSGFISFSNTPEDKYDSYNALPGTVKALVDELDNSSYSASNPLYVCVWGSMNEIAIATKYLIRNEKMAALERLYVVSHWTSSFVAQGTPQNPFNVANCNSGRAACDYMHNEAKKTTAKFKFADLGSCGQGGIVSGSGSWFSGGLNGAKATALRKSKLGDLAMKSKFVFGKPDGSDCATFYTILGSHDVKLSNFNHNGVLTQTDEQSAINAYKNSAPRIWDDLLAVSNAAAVVTSVRFAPRKTYAISPNPSTHHFFLELSGTKNETEVSVFNQNGQLLYFFDKSTLPLHQLAFGQELNPGLYTVRIACNESAQVLKIVKQ